MRRSWNVLLVTSRFLLSIALPLSTLTVQADDNQCDQPRVIFPATATISDAQPEIQWTAVAGASHYHVRLVSRVPEGKVLVSLDTRATGTSLKPPQSLTDAKARVLVTVQAYCGDRASSISDPTQGGLFSVDVTPHCAQPTSIRTDGQGKDRVIVWQATAKAQSYQVNTYSVASGALVAQQEVREPRAHFHSVDGSALIVMVRPRCGASWGEAVYQAIY